MNEHTGLVQVRAGGLSLPDPSILAGQLTPSSIAKYRHDMGAYLAWCADTGLAAGDPRSLARWAAHMALETQLSPNTINRQLSAVKRVAREAATQGYFGADVAVGFAGVAGVKPRALKDRLRANARTRIEPADMRQLCDAPDSTTLKGKRDRALLATLASSGIRVSELVGLKTTDVVRRGGGYFVSVLGKTDVEPREAPLSVEAHRLISAWLKTRSVVSDYIFTSFGGRGRDGARALVKPLSVAAAWQTVQHYAQACGLEHIKVHDFRRFVGTQLAAKDIRKAQRALGHKRIDTTARHYVLDELEPGLTDNLY